MVKIIEVKVFTTKACPYCGILKEWFHEHKINFQEIDISSDRKAAEYIIKKSKQMAVPVTEIDGKIVVGFDVEKLSKILKIK